jgi:predicted amidohydrolase
MRVAAFQRTALFDDPEAVIRSITADLLWAEAQGIDLAIFPECYLQGHSYYAELSARRALSLDDPLMSQLFSTPSKTTAIVGYFERRDQAVYNSAVVFGSSRLLGNYAKAHPTEEGCTPGESFPVWSRSGWTFGINICGDLNYPETADKIVSNGARLICCPLNMMLRPLKAQKFREISLAKLRECAVATGAWVVSADVIGDNSDSWMSFGCTAIVNPDGEIVARAEELVEGVVVFDLPEHAAVLGRG